jgi:hypothetical protein
MKQIGHIIYPECHLERYLDCLNETDSKSDSSCENNCPTACLSSDLTLDWIFHDWTTRKNGTKIEIGMSTFQYAMFNETYKWTMETFLGAFGGALGLWLGIDIIKILQFTATVLLFGTKHSMIFENDIEKTHSDDNRNTNITKSLKRYV